MEEKQLIKKIEQLRDIKPRKDWVFLTKKELFKEEKSAQVLSWLFTPINRPALAFAFRGAMALMLILTGAFFYLYYLSSNTSETTLSDLASLFENQSNNNKNKEVVASLEELQMTLKEINASLAELKNAKNQRQALVLTEVVKGTANRGKEAVKNIKAQSPSKQVLASLGAVENTFQELGELSYNIQKEMIEKVLQDLEGRTLSEEKKEFLERAKESYNQGKESEALYWIGRILNN